MSKQTNKKSSSNNNISCLASATCEWESECDNLFLKTNGSRCSSQIIARLTEITGLVYDTLNCEYFVVVVVDKTAAAVHIKPYTQYVTVTKGKGKKFVVQTAISFLLIN